MHTSGDLAARPTSSASLRAAGRVAAVATALLLAVGLLPPGPTGPPEAHAQVPDVGGPGAIPYTVTPGTLAATTGPADAEIAVTLDYDLYVPATATAATPQPAMVVAHGFGNDKTVNEVVALAALFASHGYVVLTSTHMGFGGSSGCIALDSVDYDGRNVASLVDVLADRPDVLQEAPGDPIVGMVGGSYGGGHQAGVAAIDARLDAISPGRTWNALQYSLLPNNHVTTGLWDLDAAEQGVFKRGWTSLFFALGASQPAQGGGGCDPITQQTLFPGQPPCPGFLPQVCPLLARIQATGDVTAEDRALVRRSAAAAFLDQVRVPTLLTQGLSDTLFTPAEAIATYEGLRARGVDVRLLLNDGGHGYPPQPGEGEPYAGGFDATPASQADFVRTTFARRYLGFFGHHLRGEGDPGPRVSWYRDWVAAEAGGSDADGDGDADEAYATAEDLPRGVRAYVLDAGGDAPQLRPAQAGAGDLSAASATVLNPPNGLPAAHSEVPNFQGPGQPGADIPPSEQQGQHVAFTGPELEVPLESVGAGTVRLHLASAAGLDVVLFAKLYDVAPDGTRTLIRRMVTAARVPADQLPGHATLRLPAIAHRFDAGHRVELVLATTDDSYRGAAAPDQITITTQGAESVLVLPAIGGDVVRRIAGPDRFETALRVSRDAFPDGAPAAVLAAGTSAVDALAAGGLAAAAGGPLLLTPTAELPAPVLAELRRLGADTVHVAGGTTAVAEGVAQTIRDAGFTVRRHAGPDRFATAAALATETAGLLGGVDRVVLARGDDVADALGAGSLAATGAPVLLAAPGGLPDTTADALRALRPRTLYIVGGTGALPDAVASAAAAAGSSAETRRLGGATRYETAAATVREARPLVASPETGRVDTVLVASGTGSPDALTAAPAAHALGGLLVIVDPTDLGASPPSAALLADSWQTAILVGGYAALDPRLDGQVATALGQVS